MRNKINVFLTIYFWIALAIFGLYILIFGNTLFFNSEAGIALMLLGPVFIIIEIILSIIMIIVSKSNDDYKNLKNIIVLLPWIIVFIFIFPFIFIGPLIDSKEMKMFIYKLEFFGDIIFFVYLVLCFFKEWKLVEKGDKDVIWKEDLL